MARIGGSARQSLFGPPPSTAIQHGSGRELDPQALFEKMLKSPKEWTEEDMQRELEGEDGKSTVKHLNPEFSPEAIAAGNATRGMWRGLWQQGRRQIKALKMLKSCAS